MNQRKFALNLLSQGHFTKWQRLAVMYSLVSSCNSSIENKKLTNLTDLAIKLIWKNFPQNFSSLVDSYGSLPFNRQSIRLSWIYREPLVQIVAWEPFCSKCHFWTNGVMYIVGIRRARSIFMQNCESLLPFCEELLTGLFCSISKTTYVIRTRVYYVHFSQWELLMSQKLITWHIH